MPQPRERQPKDEQRNQQDQSSGKQEKKALESETPREQRESPDRFPEQRRQAKKPADVDYPEQDPSGKAERPDAVEGADPQPRNRESHDDLD